MQDANEKMEFSFFEKSFGCKHGLDAVVCVYSTEENGQMSVNSAFAHAQGMRNLFVGFSLHQKREHFDLPLGQTVQTLVDTQGRADMHAPHAKSASRSFGSAPANTLRHLLPGE